MSFDMLTPDLLTDMAYARHRDALADAGVRLLPEDIPRINEIVGADPALIDADAITGEPEHRMRAFRVIVRNAMTRTAQELLAAGVDRSSSPDPVGLGTPAPDVWSNGTALHRVAHTVMAELDAAAAVDSMGGELPRLREISGLGRLFTIEEMAEMLQVSAPTLAAWRREGLHFEYLKFPGGRGLVRYTERGVRAFFTAHTPAPVAV